MALAALLAAAVALPVLLSDYRLFLVTMTLITAIAVLRLEGAGRPDHAKLPDGIWSGIVEGIRFVWNNKVLRTLAFVDLAITGLYMPMESVLFPKYFTDRNEPAHLGWVLMALSIGGLIGALGYAALSGRMRKRTTMLTAALQRDCTSIFFESPYRLVDTLAILAEAAPEHRVVVARELTKKFEEFKRGPASILLSYYQTKTPKGEITLLIAPVDPPKWLTW